MATVHSFFVPDTFIIEFISNFYSIRNGYKVVFDINELYLIEKNRSSPRVCLNIGGFFIKKKYALKLDHIVLNKANVNKFDSSKFRFQRIMATAPTEDNTTGTASKDVANITKRSLIVDEDAFEEQFLRCHICNERFDQGERSPKSLPCNHTFCLPCLKQVFDHNPQNQRRSVAWLDETFEGVLKCPECRVEIFLSRSEISALPPDHRVIQMMDFLSQVTAKSQNVCVKHDNQSLNFFCKKCLVPVCRDCTVLDHKEQQGHNIVDVAEALTENSTDFETIENTSKSLLDKMKARTDSLANASKQLDLQDRQLKGTIKDTFIEYRLLLERRQEALIKILKDTVKDQKQKINTKFVDICTQGSELQKLHDSFKAARSNNDISTLFTIQQQMKDKETEFTCTADANDDELFVACRFNNESECLFLSEMSGLGEVTSEKDLELKKPVPAHQLVLLDNLERNPVYQRISASVDMDDEELPGSNSSRSRAARSEGGGGGGGRISSATLARLTRRNLHESQANVDVDQYMADTLSELNLDESEERDTREALASSYLMRIANRLNESAAEMAEVLNEAETSSPDTSPTSSSRSSRRVPSSSDRGSRSSASASSRAAASRSSANNVRIVRHPQPPPPGSSGTSSSYSNSRYNNNDQ